jgi:uncharacterized protein (DUF2236 family)
MNSLAQPFGSEITRRIWGDPENVLLIYAGAAAEFALNPENHWLFYTGKLPSDPWRRFQDTLRYQQRLFFMPVESVPQVARHIREMHDQVEAKRSGEEGAVRISDRAFTQVFSMLIEYGIRGQEYLERRSMERAERAQYFNDIRSIAQLMGVGDFPQDYDHYLTERAQMVERELRVNAFTYGLLRAYRKHFGALGHWVLLQFLALFLEPVLARRLGLHSHPLFRFLYRLYPKARLHARLNGWVAWLLEKQAGFAFRKTITEGE